jgi:L-fucose/D-arabinose isomerase
MPATMIRLNLVDGLGPALQIAEGHTIDLPDDVHDALDQRTNPTWPTTWFAPILTGNGAFRSAYEVMNNWGANHCVMTCGHVGHLYLTLASMLRIPVYMHNVGEDRVFRPSAWRAFGTADLEAADFRACAVANYGPLYGNRSRRFFPADRRTSPPNPGRSPRRNRQVPRKSHRRSPPCRSRSRSPARRGG